jgi:hypothetical protein
MLDCRDYPRLEDTQELETILHYLGFIEFMVAIQPSFNFYADIAAGGPQELHLHYMQLIETHCRCRNLLWLLDNRYALYERTDDLEGGQLLPKSVTQWARDMMAGTGSELKHNIALAVKQGIKLFNGSMKWSIMLSNLNRVMETWSLKMGPHTGWWGSVGWRLQDFIVKYSAYGYLNGADVPAHGWIKGDNTFEGALGMASVIKNGLNDDNGSEEGDDDDEGGGDGSGEEDGEGGDGSDEEDDEKEEGGNGLEQGGGLDSGLSELLGSEHGKLDGPGFESSIESEEPADG